MREALGRIMLYPACVLRSLVTVDARRTELFQELEVARWAVNFQISL